MELIIENVRSFLGRHDIPIKPLTLLVGENSSGKTTLLSLLSATSDTIFFPLRPNFNLAPYNLGNFDTIATHRSAGNERAASFRIGSRLPATLEQPDYELTAEYTSRNGAIEVSGIEAKSEENSGVINFYLQEQQSSVECLLYREGREHLLFRGELTAEMRGPLGRFVLYQFLQFLFLPRSRSGKGLPDEETAILQNTFLELFYFPIDFGAVSLAPIRMRPQRIYDLFDAQPSPEGKDLPTSLAELLDEPISRQALNNFGRESGLYRSLEVHSSYEIDDSSARIMVTGGGPIANLIDTGYGVSQALPVVVESIRAEPDTMLLLQQPEVHLHPRAQAALGTLFVELIKAENKRFVVETHSDYIIDRVRIEVAKGNIAPEDVCILYFEKPEDATTVYPITLDACGNILDAPPSYRAFFLKESLTLLGIEGG